MMKNNETHPSSQSTPRWFIALFLLVSLIFLAIGYVRSESALINAFDTGLYLQILENLDAGRGWASSVTREANFLGHHFQPILLVLEPFLGLIKSTFSLLALGWFFTTASFVFLLLHLPRRGIATVASTAIVLIATLLHPGLANRIYYSFVPEIIALPFLSYIAALLARTGKIERKELPLIFVSMVLAALCKETIWITSAWCSLLLAIKFRKQIEARLFAVFALLFLATFIYLFTVWMPAHSNMESYYGLSYYKNDWVEGRFGLAGKILGAILNAFSLQSLSSAVVLILIIPMATTIFGNLWALAGALPALGIIMAASSNQIHNLNNHYFLAALPFLAVSSATGLDAIAARIGNLKLLTYLKASLIVAPLAFLTMSYTGLVFQVLFAKEQMSFGIREATQKLKEIIPSEDLILMDGSFQPFFADRPHVKTILGFEGNPTKLTEKDLADAKYVITENDLSEVTDCRSLKPGSGDLSLYDYEGFYNFCDWMKTTAFEKTVIIPNRLIYLKKKP